MTRPRNAALQRQERMDKRAAEKEARRQKNKSPSYVNRFTVDEGAERALNQERGGTEINEEDSLHSDIMEAIGTQAETTLGAAFGNEDIIKIVLNIIKAAVPAIVTAVKKRLEVNLNLPIPQQLHDHHRELLESRYRVDALEQYTRKENIRIFHLDEEPAGTESEDQLVEKVCQLAAAAGAVLEERDISTAHRLGGAFNQEKTRPVIVRFVNRRRRASLLAKKRALKDTECFKKVFICEDLTRMRHSVFRQAKEKIAHTFTRDGFVISKTQDSHGKDSYIYMTNPEDLFLIGCVEGSEEGEVNFKKVFGFDINP